MVIEGMTGRDGKGTAPMIERRLSEVNLGSRLLFAGDLWTVRQVVYDPRWRAYFAVDSDAGEHAEIAADGTTGDYQLLEREAEPLAPPAAARDSDQGWLADTAPTQPGGVQETMESKAPADLAETLAPSPAASARSMDAANTAQLAGARRMHPGPLPSRSAANSPRPSIAEPIPDRFAPRPWRP